MALTLPQNVAETALAAEVLLAPAQEATERNASARPFGLVLGKIARRLRPVASARGELFSPAGFKAQAVMIRMYLDTGQVQQALTLTREVLLSRAVDEMAPGTYLEPESRKAAEKALHEWASIPDGGTFAALLPESERTERMRRRQMGMLWQEVGKERNTVSHAGMGKRRIRTEVLYHRAEAVCRRVADLISADKG
jgi:hypothetical protein